MAKQHEATMELRSLLDVPSDHFSAKQKEQDQCSLLAEVGHVLCGVPFVKV